MAISVADDCFVGRRNFFSSGRAIRLAPFVLTAHDCHFLGSTHNIEDPLRPIITTGTTSGDVISIGANTFVASGVRIVGNVSVGHGSVIAAGSLVLRDIPPFSLAAGSPAVVKKRYSFARASWVAARDFSDKDEQAIPTELDYLDRLRSHGPISMPYIAAGSDMGSL